MLMLLTQKGWVMNEMKRIFLGWHFLYWIFFFYILFLQFCRFSKRITRDDGIEPKKWDLKKKKWILFETFFPKKFETFSCVFFYLKFSPARNHLEWNELLNNQIGALCSCVTIHGFGFSVKFSAYKLVSLSLALVHTLSPIVSGRRRKIFNKQIFFVFFSDVHKEKFEYAN